MPLRLKLILSFVAIILTAVGIFSVVAYTSARDYTQHLELVRLHKSNSHLIKMLGRESAQLDKLQAMIPHHENEENTYSIIDLQQASTIPGGSFRYGNEVFSALSIQHGEAQNLQGNFSVAEEEYLWAADRIPNSQYLIVDAYHRDRRDIATFLKYIGTPLSVTLFFSIWMALWASAVLAKLFQQIAEKNDQLEYQANHDLLTKLPNRNAIGRIVEQTIASAKIKNKKILFCLIDLDGLKAINDSLGHESGDTLLNQVTRRLQHTLRSTDHIGRYGGNKFTLMLEHSETSHVETICNKLLENFEPIFEVNGQSLYVRATIGMAMFPDHATRGQELIQKAETALHNAKKLAVDFAMYDAHLDKDSRKRLHLTHDLRNAIHNEELKLFFQPQLNVKSGKITSVEALARWTHPQQGFIPPDVFIEIAEHTGLIQPLTDWVLRTAIRQCAQWQDMGIQLGISVNLSARNLHDEMLGGQIANLLEYWQVSPDKLCLEITETAMMTNPEHARKLLTGLDSLGVRISIDDFGTGYSSLGYLKQLPVDELKIDKSFVLNMAQDENDASIVRATVSLAHDLGLDVVAEGVEDQASQNELNRLGCEYIQGYHIGRPMPHDELTSILLSAEASNDDKLADTGTEPPP